MLLYDPLPWRVSMLLGVVLFLLYVGVRILAGTLFAYVLTVRTRPDSSSMSGSRRLAYVLLGSLLAGAVQLTCVGLISTYA